MQVFSWKSVSRGVSALEMFERELGQVFSCPTTLSSELEQRGSAPGTGWSGMMGTCHQETLQVLLVAGPDHQQARYPTRILRHKQQASHKAPSYLSPWGQVCFWQVASPVPTPWWVPQPSHGDPASPSQGQPFPPQALH